jgi:hypothetical protein
MGLFNWNGAPDALVQIGLINVSRGAATVPIGLINSVSGGIFNPALFLDDMEFLNLSLRSGSKNFYTVLVCGIRQIDFGARTWYIINNQKDDYLITGRGGFGFEFGISKRFFLDADGLCGGIFDIHKPLRGDGGESGLEGVPVTLMAQLRLAAGFRLWEHLAAFGGISYNYFYRGNQNAPLPQEHMTLHIFSPNALGHIQRIGFFAGIQF